MTGTTDRVWKLAACSTLVLGALNCLLLTLLFSPRYVLCALGMFDLLHFIRNKLKLLFLLERLSALLETALALLCLLYQSSLRIEHLAAPFVLINHRR